MCGETEIPAHALMTTVNQLKEPAAADENTPTGFQRQFKVSDSILCLYTIVRLCSVQLPVLMFSRLLNYCWSRICHCVCLFRF